MWWIVGSVLWTFVWLDWTWLSQQLDNAKYDLFNLFSTWHWRVDRVLIYCLQRCIRELRERVANGGDSTKLHEPATENNLPVNAQGILVAPYQFLSNFTYVLMTKAVGFFFHILYAKCGNPCYCTKCSFEYIHIYTAILELKDWALAFWSFVVDLFIINAILFKTTKDTFFLI